VLLVEQCQEPFYVLRQPEDYRLAVTAHFGRNVKSANATTTATRNKVIFRTVHIILVHHMISQLRGGGRYH